MKPSDIHWEGFKKVLKSIDLDRAIGTHEERDKQASEEHRSFVSHMDNGKCYVCGKDFNSFATGQPCAHWLARPHGAKKYHIQQVLETFGYHKAASFIRWLANYEKPFASINDLTAEGKTGALFHWSCRYKHVKWTFLCMPNDFHGHEGSNTDFAHYHLKMDLNDKPFIKFAEHIHFTKADLLWLRANLDPDSPVKQTFGARGSGVDSLLSLPPEFIIENTLPTHDEERATVQLDSIMFSEDGISGDSIADALELQKQSGKSMAWCLRQIGLNPTTIISPGPAIPEIDYRTPAR